VQRDQTEHVLSHDIYRLVSLFAFMPSDLWITQTEKKGISAGLFSREGEGTTDAHSSE